MRNLLFMILIALCTLQIANCFAASCPPGYTKKSSGNFYLGIDGGGGGCGSPGLVPIAIPEIIPLLAGTTGQNERGKFRYGMCKSCQGIFTSWMESPVIGASFGTGAYGGSGAGSYDIGFSVSVIISPAGQIDGHARCADDDGDGRPGSPSMSSNTCWCKIIEINGNDCESKWVNVYTNYHTAVACNNGCAEACSLCLVHSDSSCFDFTGREDMPFF